MRIIKKVERVNLAQARQMFNGKMSGGQDMRPLRHKNGKAYSDVDYFKLLGARCKQLEAENKNPRLPVDYASHGFAIEAVNVAKRVCDMLEKGYTEKEAQAYISQCVVYN